MTRCAGTCRSSLALALAMAAGLASAAARAETTLTISSWAPPTHLMTKDVVLGWARAAEAATQGRVKFRVLPKHPSAPPGTFDAVRDGLTDVSFAVEGYLPARFTLPTLAELAGGGATAEINSVAYSRIHWRHFDKAGEFRGVKLLGVFTHGPGQMFNTKRAVATLEDLKGLKFRTGGGVAQQMAAALGATSFVKPSTETYELLSTGVADGVFFPLESVYAFKLHTIVKHATLFPGGFYSSTLSLIMNEGKWRGLAKADQDAIAAVSGETLARMAGKAWDAADRAALDELKKAGVVLTAPPPALVAEVRARAAALEKDWIKAAGAKGVDGAKALVEFRAEIEKVAAGR
jgi:TRAP-type transport system periplasmic protein